MDDLIDEEQDASREAINFHFTQHPKYQISTKVNSVVFQVKSGTENPFMWSTTAVNIELRAQYKNFFKSHFDKFKKHLAHLESKPDAPDAAALCKFLQLIFDGNASMQVCALTDDRESTLFDGNTLNEMFKEIRTIKFPFGGKEMQNALSSFWEPAFLFRYRFMGVLHGQTGNVASIKRTGQIEVLDQWKHVVDNSRWGKLCPMSELGYRVVRREYNCNNTIKQDSDRTFTFMTKDYKIAGCLQLEPCRMENQPSFVTKAFDPQGYCIAPSMRLGNFSHYHNQGVRNVYEKHDLLRLDEAGHSDNSDKLMAAAKDAAAGMIMCLNPATF